MLRARPGPTSPLPPGTDIRVVAPTPTAMAGVLGFVGGSVVTLAAALLGARDAPLFGLALLAATATAIAATTTIGGALAAAAPCWALWSGFLLNDLGRLTLTTADLRGLIVIATPAAVVAALSTARRHVAPRGAGRAQRGHRTPRSERAGGRARPRAR